MAEQRRTGVGVCDSGGLERANADMVGCAGPPSRRSGQSGLDVRGFRRGRGAPRDAGERGARLDRPARRYGADLDGHGPRVPARSRGRAWGPRVIPAGVAIYLAVSAVDLRAGFDRLAGFVREELRGDPRSGSLFLFSNRRRTHLKALFFDRTGYCILYKRLERGTFPMPTVIAPGSSRTEISSAELTLILEGLAPLSGRRRRMPDEEAMTAPTPMADNKVEPVVH